MSGITRNSVVPLCSMAEYQSATQEKPLNLPEIDTSKEILAWGMAIFDGMKPLAYQSHRALAAQLGREYPYGNLWLLSIAERLPYPFAIFNALNCMFVTEKAVGRKADWFFWLDDDMVVPTDCVKKLRAAADPVERPYVAAVGYDRMWPHKPAVWTKQRFGETEQMRRLDPIPASGIHRVGYTGLSAVLFHRSLFDRVSEPWFAVVPPLNCNSGEAVNGMNPDIWWCQQMEQAGVPVHICCDFDVFHLGAPAAAGRTTAHVMRTLNRAGRKEPD